MQEARAVLRQGRRGVAVPASGVPSQAAAVLVRAGVLGVGRAAASHRQDRF